LLTVALGVGLLWAGNGPVPAAIALATVGVYVLAYTPLKPVTSVSTLVGAVPGALPPLIGWTAATEQLGWNSLADPGAWTLFLIMFVWQIPHFLAIAWMYRDDYARAGYRMLPMGDDGARWTSVSMLAWTLLLLPVSLAPIVLMQAGPAAGYALVAIATGLGFLWLVVRLVRQRTRELARTVFFASIIHLPVLLVVLVADTMIPVLW
jgi:protoheme IX farnesyltransferase